MPQHAFYKTRWTLPPDALLKEMRFWLITLYFGPREIELVGFPGSKLFEGSATADAFRKLESKISRCA